MNIQPTEQIDQHYSVPDPWGYIGNRDDERRKTELLSLLPEREWRRVLDIGCGDAFVTFDLPGDEVIGVDISAAAIGWANERKRQLGDKGEKFHFHCASIFNLASFLQGEFDLVVITGVLYPQYIGAGAAAVRAQIDWLLAANGTLASCHIDEWNPPRFAYTLVDKSLYPYRTYTHRLETYIK